jgi:hypothetical protein
MFTKISRINIDMENFYQHNFVLIWLTIFTILSIWLMTLFSRNAQKIKRLMEDEQHELLQKEYREAFKSQDSSLKNDPTDQKKSSPENDPAQ